MAHFAKVNTVTNVVENVFEHEDGTLGPEWGNPIHYIEVPSDQTAHIGGKYIRSDEKFVPPKEFDSWVLNSDNVWVAPVDKPSDANTETNPYVWNEENQTWDPK